MFLKLLTIGQAIIVALALAPSSRQRLPEQPLQKVSKEPKFFAGSLAVSPSAGRELKAGRKETFRVKGTFGVSPEITQKQVIVEVIAKSAKGKGVIHNTGLVPCEKVGDRKYRFGGEVPSPATPGKYEVAVKLNRQKIITSEETFVAPTEKTP